MTDTVSLGKGAWCCTNNKEIPPEKEVRVPSIPTHLSGNPLHLEAHSPLTPTHPCPTRHVHDPRGLVRGSSGPVQPRFDADREAGSRVSLV
jgi:hypothetical protein